MEEIFVLIFYVVMNEIEKVQLFMTLNQKILLMIVLLIIFVLKIVLNNIINFYL